MNDINAGRVPAHEERRLHEANAIAAIFFRQELLRTAVPWPSVLLETWGAAAVLNPGSTWQIGYAPGGAQLVDRLRAAGFGRETLLRSGLANWSEDGRLVDRYRGQLIVPSYDRRRDPVGFVSIDRDGQARPPEPEALVGVLEQIDLLETGATAVIVEHPLDAVAIEIGSRAASRRHVGIPLCGTPISKDQASMLRQYSVAGQVIVMVPTEFASGQRALRTAVELTEFFDHVRMIECAPGPLVESPGQLTFLADLYLEMPETSRQGGSARHDDPEPWLEGRSPELGP